MSVNDNKAHVESIGFLPEKLCEMWCDTRHKLDEHVNLFLSSAMIAILDSIPNIHTDQSLEDLKNKNEAIEELEYLSELLTTGCRHNNYGQK